MDPSASSSRSNYTQRMDIEFGGKTIKDVETYGGATFSLGKMKSIIGGRFSPFSKMLEVVGSDGEVRYVKLKDIVAGYGERYMFLCILANRVKGTFTKPSPTVDKNKTGGEQQESKPVTTFIPSDVAKDSDGVSDLNDGLLDKYKKTGALLSEFKDLKTSFLDASQSGRDVLRPSLKAKYKEIKRMREETGKQYRRQNVNSRDDANLQTRKKMIGDFHEIMDRMDQEFHQECEALGQVDPHFRRFHVEQEAKYLR